MTYYPISLPVVDTNTSLTDFFVIHEGEILGLYRYGLTIFEKENIINCPHKFLEK